MANEADLLSAAASLRNAELVAGYTAYQLRQRLTSRGRGVVPVVGSDAAT